MRVSNPIHPVLDMHVSCLHPSHIQWIQSWDAEADGRHAVRNAAARAVPTP